MEKFIHASVGVFLGWIIASVIFWAFCWGSAYGAEVAYEFKTVDVVAEDIDDDGTLLATVGIDVFDWRVITIDPNPRRGKNKNISFDCGEIIYGTAISNGRITGYCDSGAFIRQKDGTITILALEHAVGMGIAKDGTVGGSYCPPNGPPNFGCTPHGFTWHPDRGYKTIDYLDGRPGSRTVSGVLAPISNGRVLGGYSVADSNNNILEAGYYIYDNGTFDTASLPKSFEHIGGPGVYISDMNDLGQVIIQRWNIQTPYLEMFDDGIFFQIGGWPAQWRLQQLNGGNNEGQFTGVYSIQTGIDPYYGSPIYAYHGFVATPEPIRRARK